jgi:23S rRNA (cytidine1920-2'-O)/16S rRNA (cytidine1409-2'-O)-methyltransferase
MVSTSAEIRLAGAVSPYVSRGGEKMAGALTAFEPIGLTAQGKSAADFGASTGGFTDCLLQHGALKVFAIDVGQALLHEKLRQDPRVIVMDRTNARDLSAEHLGGPVDIVVVDASFIGLEKLLDAAKRVLKPRTGELVALVKPQFEAGKQEVSKGHGVIRDEQVRARIVSETIAKVASAGFAVLGDAPCVIRGPKGNLEHFVYARILEG